MLSSKTFLKIKNDKSFLLKLYLKDMGLTCLVILLAGNSLNPESFTLAHLCLIPIALIFGCLVASFLHNTCHQNVPNKWLNRLIGEFCGAWVLYGFSNFIMIHFLHHQHSDKELDPVNPKGMSFFVFLSAPMRYMIGTAKKWLRLKHGDHHNYESTMSAQIIVFHLNLVLKLVMWHSIFGTTGFLTFYLPSLLANYGILAHINYVCHRDLENGEVEIVNLNHNFYYKFANLITFGGYFHKNHHLKMGLFNPMRLGKSDTAFTMKENYRGSFVSRYFNTNEIWGDGQKNKIQKSHNQMKILRISAIQALRNTTPRERRRA